MEWHMMSDDIRLLLTTLSKILCITNFVILKKQKYNGFKHCNNIKVNYKRT